MVMEPNSANGLCPLLLVHWYFCVYGFGCVMVQIDNPRDVLTLCFVTITVASAASRGRFTDLCMCL